MKSATFRTPSLKNRAPASAALLSLIGSNTALAHPGHGLTPDGDSATHYLLEPIHGGVYLVLGVVASAAIVLLVARRRARRSEA